MKPIGYYTTSKRPITTQIAIALLIILIGYGIGSGICRAIAEKPLTLYVMCQPDSHVCVRRTPDKRGQEVGFLECGDSFQTDGSSNNGYLRVLDVGEFGEAWIYCGYTVTEKPEAVFENYVCVARKRVAVRKWVDGPQVSGKPWLKNGSTVQVFYAAGDWCVTNRGYIRTEYLEVDPV